MKAQDRATALFDETFQASPEGVWSAPGRVNLIGEHTDYNDGFVLPIALESRTAVAAGVRLDHRIVAHSESEATVAEANLGDLDAAAMSGWAGYVLGLVWALKKNGIDVASLPGLSLAIASDVPTGAGLSSSAALECAVAMALNDVWNLGWDKQALAALGQQAENEVVGANTGIMDQSVSMFGAEGHAVFLDCRSKDHDLIPFRPDTEGLALVVMDTGIRHSHATNAYGVRRRSCEQAATALGVSALRDATVSQLGESEELLGEETFRRARHIVTENGRVQAAVQALETGNLGAFGSLLTESHASMRDDYEISIDRLDRAVEVALSVGALGARMTGGGFGGSAIALLPGHLMDVLADELVKDFTSRRWNPPIPSVVFAGDGATRDR